MTDALRSIEVGVETCLENWCSKNALQICILRPWQHKVRDLIKERIDFLKCVPRPCISTETLNDPEVRLSLKDLHNKYVVCPIYKATGNVSLICKRFYSTVLCKELGVHSSCNNSTYTRAKNLSVHDVTSKHKHDLSKEFCIPYFD